MNDVLARPHLSARPEARFRKLSEASGEQFVEKSAAIAGASNLPAEKLVVAAAAAEGNLSRQNGTPVHLADVYGDGDLDRRPEGIQGRLPSKPGVTTQAPRMPWQRNKDTPRTLYAWMSLEQAQGLLNTGSDEGVLKRLDRPMFFWRTPAGSFGYGDYCLRAKLRDDVTFVELPMFTPTGESPRDIRLLRSRYDVTRTVFVTGLSSMGYREFIVADPAVFHSISFGTPEYTAELKAEAKQISQATSRDEYDLIIKTADSKRVFDPQGLRQGIEWDHVTWSLAGLEQRVRRHETALPEALNNVLRFAPGVEPDRSAHFSPE